LRRENFPFQEAAKIGQTLERMRSDLRSLPRSDDRSSMGVLPFQIECQCKFMTCRPKATGRLCFG